MFLSLITSYTNMQVEQQTLQNIVNKLGNKPKVNNKGNSENITFETKEDGWEKIEVDNDLETESYKSFLTKEIIKELANFRKTYLGF